MPPPRPLRSLDEFDEWFASKQADGEGYAEVSSGGSGYPLLTFSFRGTAAVVHCFPSPEQVLLLVGDGVVGDEDALDFPVLDMDCPFTGAFISRWDRARRIADEVLRGGSLEGVGRWERM